MPEIVVFLGPSAPVELAREILEADYRPPAMRGDIPRAVKDGARIIGLIDGVFFQDCAVGHREILDALKRGVKMVGASSMGALRASETDIFGMEGVGEIYRMYRSGELDSDDEVALTFDPLGLAPISEPLVNIRFNLRLAREKGFIDAGSEEALLALAQSVYFPDRSYRRLIQDAEGRVPEEARSGFQEFLERERRDLKREDAQQALRRIRELAEELRAAKGE
ncbi:MAG: TfuA-related McrA-glycine thioamidation protein [Methanosarcinales archaeon]|nr:TfuA-related McrA-glycine thioamidation protein [Methanosarcinales archaeon]